MATEQTHTTDIREVTERWMQGWNEKDADLLVSLVADDLHYTDPSWPEVMRTGADVRAFTSAVWRAMPDVQFTEPLGLAVSEDGSWASAPWHMSGTLTGSFDPPGYAPTGDPLEIDGVDVFEVRDGKIARLATHFDAMEIGRTIGLLPARGSRAERMAARAQGLMAKVRRR
jgi:steroid delta-isomerase-like uncharacterized protein